MYSVHQIPNVIIDKFKVTKGLNKDNYDPWKNEVKEED